MSVRGGRKQGWVQGAVGRVGECNGWKHGVAMQGVVERRQYKEW